MEYYGHFHHQFQVLKIVASLGFASRSTENICITAWMMVVIFIRQKKGLSGGALSPLIGGGLLRHVDMHFSMREDLFYARYMDDVIFLPKHIGIYARSLKRCINILAGWV